MKKIIALFVGLLMVGGMMGMVSADFFGEVLKVNNEYGTYYLETREVPWDTYEQLSEITQFDVQLDSSISPNYDFGGSSVCISILEISTDNGEYGFYYCPNSTTVVIKGTNQNDIQTDIDPTKVNPAHTFRIVATKNNDGTWDIEFLVDGVSKGTYSSISLSSINEVRAGTSASGPQYDLYIDNIQELVQGDYLIQKYEDFEDDTDDYFEADKDGGGTETFVSADQVPFFSNAGIAAVALLLVLGAVWFFRRS